MEVHFVMLLLIHMQPQTACTSQTLYLFHPSQSILYHAVLCCTDVVSKALSSQENCHVAGRRNNGRAFSGGLVEHLATLEQ